MNEPVVRPPRQRGRASSERALVHAAIVSFAETGPNAVSVRAIAERAGVNHGLVHHYFGSKAGLIRAVVVYMTTHIAEMISEGVGASALTEEGGEGLLYARAFSRIVVDGAMPVDVDWDFPVITAVSGAAQRLGGLDAENARIAATQALAMMMGWTLLESWILRALDKTPADANDLRSKLPAAAMRLANIQVPH